MAITSKKPETPAVPTAVLAPVKAPVEKAPVAKAAEKAAPAKKAPAKKAPAAKKAAPSKPAAKKAPAAKEAKVQLFVEYQGQQVNSDDVLAAVRAKWTGGAIKTLELYMKPEDHAAYYVINGKDHGKVEF